MMRAAWLCFVTAAAMAVSACANEPVSRAASSNPDVPVALLFEHDGCQVFRFHDDGHNRYYTRCRLTTSTASMHKETCGKACVESIPEVIDTANKEP